MTDEFENRHLHHRLLKVSRLVLDNLDGDDLMSLHVLTLDDLSKRSLSQHVQDQVPVLVFRTEDVIDVEDVVAVLVVESVVLGGFRRFCQDSTRVQGGFVMERRVDEVVRLRKVSR